MTRRSKPASSEGSVPTIAAALGSADAVIVVPPFARLPFPSHSAHLLQAIGRERGLRISVLYANFVWARMVGRRLYESICQGAPYDNLAGEWLMSPAAFGQDAPVNQPQTDYATAAESRGFDEHTARRLQALACEWADSVATALAARPMQFVGCTNTFEQTCASVAILKRVKELCPSIVTILGGGNCEGEMADGIASLSAPIDHIFRGESEETFSSFVSSVRNQDSLEKGILQGRPCTELDELPTPCFEDFFRQHELFLPDEYDPAELWVTLESSRGCWWGEKRHCTFCGFNGVTMRFREKSPGRLLSEITEVVTASPTRKICMTDNIMPFRYFRSVLPRLASQLSGLNIYFEQKANLSLPRVKLLKEAGVGEIQAGIEAISTPLLVLMKKGTTATQNIALMRYAKAVGLTLNWSLLYGFPADESPWYTETLRLIPMLTHLQAPAGFHRLTIDRFSPYFTDPEGMGVFALRPFASYAEVFPGGTEMARIAYHFEGSYQSDSLENPQLIEEIQAAIAGWREQNTRTHRAELRVDRIESGAYVLLDTRGVSDEPALRVIGEEQARTALSASPGKDPAMIEWAVREKVGAWLDGHYVPLALASVDLLEEFEALGPQPALPLHSASALSAS